MNTIWMVRHGKPSSTWGDGDADPGLDETGQAQALAARDYFLALETRPVGVASSPLRRCRETAEPLARALGVDLLIIPEIGEIPTPKALAEAERPAWLQAAFKGRWDEIRGDLDYDQWRAGVARAAGSKPGFVLFSHYVAINGVVSLCEGTPQVLAFAPDHASITTLRLSQDRLDVVSRGQSAQTQVL